MGKRKWGINSGWDIPSYAERKWQPYVTAIGQAALAWNALHEGLGILFWALNGRIAKQRPQAIWNSTDNDVAKRKLLAAVAMTLTNNHLALYPKMEDDLGWLLDRTNAVGKARNDAVHSPLFIPSWREKEQAEERGQIVGQVYPNTDFGNPRALALANKDLLTEYRWCRDAAAVLLRFTSQIDFCVSMNLIGGDGKLPLLVPWPDRPRMPNRGQKKRRQRRPLRSSPK